MKIHTAYFGEIDISEEQIIEFYDGLPGFEEYHQFVLLPGEESGPFSYLQAVDSKNPAFIMADPFIFFQDYEFVLSDSAQQDLGLSSAEDVTILVIVNVPENWQESTANLLAPVVLNMGRRKGKQIILHNSSYTTKHKLQSTDSDGSRGGDEDARSDTQKR